jgi:hypothetical protein
VSHPSHGSVLSHHLLSMVADQVWISAIDTCTENRVQLFFKYDKTSCFKQIKFTIEDTKVKHTNIATICDDNYSKKVFTKVIKMPSWKVLVQRSSSPVKSGRKHEHF